MMMDRFRSLDEYIYVSDLPIVEDIGSLLVLVIEVVSTIYSLGEISAVSLVEFLENCYEVKITSVKDRVVEELFRMAKILALQQEESSK
jgi:hypothetical protein